MGLIGVVSIGESCVSVISAAGCQPSGKPGSEDERKYHAGGTDAYLDGETE